MSSMGSFFYWGLEDLPTEINDDVQWGLIQPKRSMFYNRGYGAGLAEFENAPIGLQSMVLIKYEAAKFMAVRNSVVTNGSSGYPERRVATSQDIITVDVDGNGQAPGLNVNVPFIMLTNMKKSRGFANLGGSK